MGRETKLLLALLATLTGVFVGVLSMKLLVARPPVGAGPDVDVATAEPHEIVAPPTLSSPTAAVAGERRRDAEDVVTVDAARAPAFDREAAGVPPRRDPFVAVASFEQPAAAERPADRPLGERVAAVEAAPSVSAFAPPISDMQPSAAQMPPSAAPAGAGRHAIEPVGPPVGGDVPAGLPETVSPSYVAAAGDSWWELAERAYGDGRLYRALYAWNRAVDPRVTLAPGTRLEMPSRERLEAAWPRLAVPR